MKRDSKGLFVGEKGLGGDRKPHCFKISEPYHGILQEMQDKSEFLRKAIINQMVADGLIIHDTKEI
jgi:hypothetical protein